MRWMGILATTLALGATVACGDDEGDGGTGGTGGTGATGGSSGDGGSSASGGSAGDDGSGGSTGGAAGSAGSAGAAGSAGSAGAAGAAGSAGAAGGPAAWDLGTMGAALSEDDDDRLWGVTFDEDNNFYVVGYVDDGGNRQMVVAKYNTDAELDGDFGTDGLTIVDLSSYAGTPDDEMTEDVDEEDTSVEEARDVVLQEDGKIVVVGRVEDPTDAAPTSATPVDVVLFRLNADGTLDDSFGDPAFAGTAQEGLAILNFGDLPEDQVWSLDIDSDGRLYVFGSGQTSDAERTDQDRYAARLTADGVLDDTFGDGGFATFDVPQNSLSGDDPVTLGLNDNQRHGFALSGGGAISAGYTNVAGRNAIVLAQFTDAGLLDPAFSGDGIVRLSPFPSGMAEAYGVAIQSDGSYVTTGYGRVDLESTERSDVDLVSVRVTPEGELDPSWGVDGVFVFDSAMAEDRGRYVFALSDDRIMMVGATTVTGDNKDAMLLLLEKDGSISQSFNGGGPLMYEFDGRDEFYSAALSPDGSFIAAVGYASGGSLTNGNATLVVLPVGD